MASGGKSDVISSESQKRLLLNQNDAESRRQIRHDYLKLKDDLEEQKRDLIDPSDDANLLQQRLLEVDNLFTNVQQPREGALDSASLVQIADLGVKKAQALQADFVKFNPTDFCEKVKVLFGVELDSEDGNALQFPDQSWVKWGSTVAPLFSKAPILRFMCGSFERGEVSLKRQPRVSREEKVDNASGKATKPTQLSKFERVEGGGELTTAFVEHVLKTLWSFYEESDHEPVDFFEFVTHPTSFGQTVENIFYTSFLIRDGHARLSMDSDKLPVLEPIHKGETISKEESSVRKQLVLTVTPAEWKEIVDKFDIQEPLIKPMTTEIMERDESESS